MKYITLDELEERHQKQVEYFKEKLKGSSIPKPLFKESGDFNEDNWNSGEGIIIRNVMREIESNGECSTRNEVELFYPEADLTVYARLIIHHTWIEDYQFLTILVDGDTMVNDDDVNYFTDQYVIKVYKNRGGIELFLKNGKSITKNEYLSLLHILQSADLIKGEY